MNDWIIEVSNLTKSYNGYKILDDISLKVPRRSVFGYLGPNGAGKTTTIRIVLGLIRPDRGEVRLRGEDPVKKPEKVFSRVGYAPELPTLQGFLTAGELLDFTGRMYGMSSNERRRQAKRLLELVGLADHAEKKIGKFSKGMVQRLSVAQSLMNDPELVIMDEPTLGLDPAVTVYFRELFKSFPRDGISVFLSSHLLDEVQRVCSHVAMIHRGRIHFQGLLNDVLNSFKSSWIMEVELREVNSRLVNCLERLDFVEKVSVDGNRLSIFLRDKRDLRGEISTEIVRNGGVLLELTTKKISLEEAYLKAIRGGELN